MCYTPLVTLIEIAMTISKVCVRIPGERKDELLRLASSWRAGLHQRGPGWDAQIIHRIAASEFGSLKAMFRHHGWPERGSRMMPCVQKHVCETYGSVESFVKTWCPSLLESEDTDFPFGAWGRPKETQGDGSHMVGPTDDSLLDEMGL